MALYFAMLQGPTITKINSIKDDYSTISGRIVLPLPILKNYRKKNFPTYPQVIYGIELAF